MVQKSSAANPLRDAAAQLAAGLLLLASAGKDAAGPIEKRLGTLAEGRPSGSRIANFWQLQGEVLSDAATLRTLADALEASAAVSELPSAHDILRLDKLAEALELGANVSRSLLVLFANA